MSGVAWFASQTWNLVVAGSNPASQTNNSKEFNMTETKLFLPAQIETLIWNMQNKQEDVFIRQQYRVRLGNIIDVLYKEVGKFDRELDSAVATRNVKGKQKVSA